MTLPFEQRTSLAGEDFLVSTGNRDAVAWVDRWPDWPAAALVVFGDPGCGKTHLASVFLARTHGRMLAHDPVADVPPDVLLDGASTAVIDDADRLVAAGIEEPMLHLYNTAVETGCCLLLTASQPPARWSIRLPDLRSRLNSCPLAGIGPPDDGLMAALVAKLLADRQLRVDQEVIGFMLTRMERSFDAARRLVTRIDEASLKQQRPITVPLVRSVLAAMQER
jgi:DnaA regulatory inactivator Hda